MKKLLTDYRLTCWDWKTPVDLKWINKCTAAGFTYFSEVDTQGDSYGVVATKTEISEAEAQKLYDDYWK